MDYINATEFYQKAAELYEGEDATSSANACLLKVAQFSSAAKDFPRAIELYEKIGRVSLDSNLLKWSAKDHFFKAGICHLAQGDPSAARRATERYADMDAGFGDSREAKLLHAMCDAVEAGDVDDFTSAVKEYDDVSKLSGHLASLLLGIKSSLKAGPSIV
jgi:alpha-soluble NSF attachment protein